jgi:hypothetical protein
MGWAFGGFWCIMRQGYTIAYPTGRIGRASRKEVESFPQQRSSDSRVEYDRWPTFKPD